MLTATHSQSSPSLEPVAPANGSAHDRPLQLAMALLAALLVLFVLGLGVVYYGDSFAKPTWSERSVPAPRLY